MFFLKFENYNLYKMKKTTLIFVFTFLTSLVGCNESASKKVDKEKSTQNASKSAPANAAM